MDTQIDKPQCHSCGEEITWGVQRTSINRFRKQLCIKCQKAEIKKTYPPKLAEFALKEMAKYG